MKAFFSDVARVFQAPFAGLPIVIWFYFVCSYIALPGNPTWRGDLPDPDDYTYLTQTLDWLRGQGWFDTIQHRMNPPTGVALHYTRLAEMPIAAVIMLFRSFHYSWRGAALLASFLLPCLYLGVFFVVLQKTAKRLVSPDWARLTAFVALFAPTLTHKFAPGQVDHHGVEAILTLAATGFVLRFFEQPDKKSFALAAGFFFALATAIALEVLPWMALASAVIGLWAVAEPTRAKAAALFGASQFGFGVFFLVLDKPVAEIFQPDLLAYSVAYVALEGGIALALLCAAAVSLIECKKERLDQKNTSSPRMRGSIFGTVMRPRWIPACAGMTLVVRLVLAGSFAVALGALYLHHFPALLAGPYGAMNSKLASLFFANLEEARPLIVGRGAYEIFVYIAMPALAFIVSLFFLRGASGYKKWGWFLFASFLATAIGLTLFYQIRVMIYALLFASIPLTALVERGWGWIGAHYVGRKRFWAEIGLVLLVGPLTVVFAPALVDGRAFNTGILLFPAQYASNSCELSSLEKILDAKPYKGRKLRMMNMLNQGPELLFYTDDDVFSAPYHTNVQGNLDSFDFFSTTDPAQAQQIARRDGVNLVVLCREVPDMYLQGKDPHYTVSPAGEVRLLPNASFAAHLVLRQLPDWLTEIPVPLRAPYQLFEVK
ncbi:MAG: hypothetical protein P4M13_09340 [Alphaproteobacteria bacterium]|nr:hypothetical protein [Alphaproteobacteria bacterium]